MDIKNKTQYARKVAVYAGVFTALVSVLLILNYVQMQSVDPVESQALERMVERLSGEPGNEELVHEIRQLDLLTRKAYFNSLWQIKTGAYLLLFGAIVLIIALRVKGGFQFSIKRPTHQSNTDITNRSLARRWISISGAVLIVVAILSALLTVDHIQRFEQKALVADEPQAEAVPETIDISPAGEPEEEEVAGIPEQEEPRHEETEDSVPHQPEEVEEEVKNDIPETGTIDPLTEEDVKQNHNMFRGPLGHSISPHGNLPTEWDVETGQNIIWKTEIPIHGYNSPVIWGDKIFLSGANESRRVVYCYNRDSGDLLWEGEADNIPGSPATPPKTTDDTGLAAPTLTVDGTHVYAIFGTGDIIAFDLDGNRVWAKNLGVPDNHYGHSSSLVTWNRKVFVQYDTHSGSKLLALDSATGDEVWETPRSNDVSWASPILAKVDGNFQLVLQANPYVDAYDPETGEQLWSVDCMSGEVGPSPVYGGGRIYAANEYAKMIAIDPTNGETIWDNNYYLPEVACPLYHDELIYIGTTFAVIACFDAETGEFVWEMDVDDGFYSSPVMADGKIYFFDLSGNAHILEPGREPNLIASNTVGERVFATPAFAEGRIYIRGNKNLYCIGTE